MTCTAPNRKSSLAKFSYSVFQGGTSLLTVFGVKVSMAFHHMFVNIISSPVYVAEWPPFGKELLYRLTICSLCSLTIYNFNYFPLWF